MLHITARIRGHVVKYVVTPGKALHKEILEAGFNSMPDRKKQDLVCRYLLH